MLVIKGSSYRPSYTIKAGNVERQVVEINFYDKDGVVVSSGNGYLEALNGNGQLLSKLELDTNKTIKLKRKLKFDGNVFVMLKELGASKYWALYIPSELANFTKVDRYIKHTNLSNHIIDKYESEVLNAEIRVYKTDINVDKRLNELRTEFEETVESYDFDISKDISADLLKLGKLKEIYDEELDRIKGLDLDSL